MYMHNILLCCCSRVGGAEGVVDGLLSVLLELLEEHAQLLMQPLNTDLFIIVCGVCDCVCVCVYNTTIIANLHMSNCYRVSHHQ